MPNKSQQGKKQEGDISPVPSNEHVMQQKNQHVVRREDGWAVRAAGNSRDTTQAKTQREAIEQARKIAKRAGAEVIVHARDGKIVGREVFRNLDWELEPYEDRGLTKEIDPGLGKYIETIHFGQRPHIRGRRLLVSMIAANEKDNQWNVSRLAEEFTLTEEQVLAALLYYHEHKGEIDLQDAREQEQFDEMARLHGNNS